MSPVRFRIVAATGRRRPTTAFANPTGFRVRTPPLLERPINDDPSHINNLLYNARTGLVDLINLRYSPALRIPRVMIRNRPHSVHGVQQVPPADNQGVSDAPPEVLSTGNQVALDVPPEVPPPTENQVTPDGVQEALDYIQMFNRPNRRGRRVRRRGRTQHDQVTPDVIPVLAPPTGNEEELDPMGMMQEASDASQAEMQPRAPLGRPPARRGRRF
ncbi:MAG: hypothetical protein LBU10_02365 [Endomicrobium sp.]|jgi:hypothetical protein|nr:hypothetical protein [Endomicrobium sp.]